METFVEYLADALRSVRSVDVIDVLLVAAFLFVLLEWLRRSGPGSVARRAVVVGVPLLLLLFLADRYDLYLVESLVRLLLVVLLLGLVVVFQTDLRRLLDRLAAWRFGRRAERTARSRAVNVLTATAAKLAESRIGALIAVRGREPWPAQLQGGIELNGLVSRPLLYSIFSPDSPGHDGAVLMEGERVISFGVHLPLSTRLPRDRYFGGTRHAAALGLSEQCDAFVIVVSEERGTISVARNGDLTQMESPRELNDWVDAFWRQHYAPDETVRPSRWGLRAVASAALALLLAIAAWFAFAYSAATLQRTFVVPIAFRDVPPEWVLEEDSVLEARVALTGSELAFRSLDPSDLVISLDLSDPEPGANEFTIGEEDIDIPSGLRLSYVDPQTIAVVARPHVAVDVPVRVRTAARIPDTLRLVPDPDTVTLLVPAGAADLPARVLTEPIEIGFPLPVDGIRARLALPPDVRLAPDESAEVTVEVGRGSQ